MTKMLTQSGVILLVMLTTACGQTQDGPEIRDAWVRAVPPTSGVAAGYFTIENHGAEPLVITGASSPVVPRVEMHHMQKADDGEHAGAFRMVQMASLRVEPGETVRFETGGRHLMLMDMARAPQEGESVQICLQPENGEPLCTDFSVRAGGGGHHH